MDLISRTYDYIIGSLQMELPLRELEPTRLNTIFSHRRKLNTGGSSDTSRIRTVFRGFDTAIFG